MPETSSPASWLKCTPGGIRRRQDGTQDCIRSKGGPAATREGVWRTRRGRGERHREGRKLKRHNRVQSVRTPTPWTKPGETAQGTGASGSSSFTAGIRECRRVGKVGWEPARRHWLHAGHPREEGWRASQFGADGPKRIEKWAPRPQRGASPASLGSRCHCAFFHLPGVCGMGARAPSFSMLRWLPISARGPRSPVRAPRGHLLLVVVLAIELSVPVEAGGLQGLFAGGALHALLVPEAVVEPQQKPVRDDPLAALADRPGARRSAYSSNKGSR